MFQFSGLCFTSLLLGLFLSVGYVSCICVSINKCLELDLLFLGLSLFFFYTAFFFKKKKWVRQCLLLYCKLFIYSNRRGLVFFLGSNDIDMSSKNAALPG